MLTLALGLALSQIAVQQEGVALGNVFVINCSGSGITCTRNASTKTVTMDVSGGGGGGGGSSDGGGIPTNIPVVTYSASSDLSAERVLSAGNYTTVDLGTATQAQVDWAHGLTCSAGQALTSSGTSAMVCTSTLTASDLACSGTCVSDAEIAAVSGAKVSGAVATAYAADAGYYAHEFITNPTDCSAGNFATAIAANGNLTCSNAVTTLEDEGTPLAERDTINFVGSGVSCVDDTTRTTCTFSGGGGGGNFVEQSIALTTKGAYFSTVVTGQSWVTSTSKVVCGAFGTTADGLTPEVVAVAGLSISVSNLSAGVGFTINIYSPYGLDGTVRVHCTGA